MREASQIIPKIGGKVNIFFPFTKPVIVFPVSVVIQLMHNLMKDQIEAVFRILGHIKGSSRKGLYIENTERYIEAYTYSY